MSWRTGLVFVLGLGAAGLLAGCSSGPASATVSGEAKVNGAPVEKGVISFSPAEGSGTSVTGDIKNGRYEVQTTAGKKVVQISAPVVTGKRKDSNAADAQWLEITEESISEKYNSKSELNFDAQAGSNTKNWDLDVKKK
jgi:hypothetical protein